MPENRLTESSSSSAVFGYWCTPSKYELFAICERCVFSLMWIIEGVMADDVGAGLVLVVGLLTGLDLIVP